MKGDYTSIKADVAELAQGVARMSGFMEHQLKIWADDPESEHFDPDWNVSFEHRDARQIVHNLQVIQGMLWHLANEPSAAEAFIRTHDETPK